MNNIINYKQKLQNEYNLKIFTDNIEYECLEQIELLLQQDMFKDCKIRIMPDCHSGKGCVIGFTANLEDKVIPNIVGVDIGCGLYCVSLGKISLNFQWLDEGIRKEVPSGREGFNETRTKFKKIQELICYRELKNHKEFERQIGTLGGGNHFIEVDIDSNGNKYLVIHSGSRNLGNQVANYYQNLAIKLHSGYDEYFEEKEQLIKYYKEHGMKNKIQDELKKLNTKYNNKKCNMPKDWNNSAPHGAGRIMSRSKAKQLVDMEEYKQSMKEIYTTSVSESTIDEAPMVYKPLEEIESNIKDTVDIVERIKPIYNFKAN